MMRYSSSSSCRTSTQFSVTTSSSSRVLGFSGSRMDRITSGGGTGVTASSAAAAGAPSAAVALVSTTAAVAPSAAAAAVATVSAAAVAAAASSSVAATTTTVAAAASIAAAATTVAAAAASTTSSAAATSFSRLVHADLAVVQVLPVHGVLRIFRVLRVHVCDEAEAARSARFSVHDDYTIFDGAIFLEGRPEHIIVGVEAQTADEQFPLVRHVAA
ncbi:hypothetical protein EYF80_032313 [Liparis tanakae]|uniref:Uncharacterized protein n=1 Tax=Liparis tanakae TaxID=230148 RepID=A0A4Z2GVL0_9TELE|nr:hypothetical protein EYF80_032313 [Liparis tanakae]